jgi:hypothetical protein
MEADPAFETSSFNKKQKDEKCAARYILVFLVPWPLPTLIR